MLETSMGDYRLSPAYDLLNSRIHTVDKDFALDEALLPGNLAQGKISQQFAILAENAEISDKILNDIIVSMLSQSNLVERLTSASFLDETTREILAVLSGSFKTIEQTMNCTFKLPTPATGPSRNSIRPGTPGIITK